MAFVQAQGEQKSEWWIEQNGQREALLTVAQKQGRPFYLYDLADAQTRAARFLESTAKIHYAMKANSHPRLLKTFAQMGLGVDVVSLGELQKARRFGFRPEKVIFSGVGKGPEEVSFAIKQKILQINAESFEELEMIESLARDLKQKASVALRVNIHLSAPTHKHIQTATETSKFGLDIRMLPEVLNWLKGKTHIELKGLAVHVGSQITDLSVFEQMAQTTGKLYKDVKTQGFPLERLDLGGGLGLDYQSLGSEDFGRLEEYLKIIESSHGTDAQVHLEPGRFLVARMGVLCAQVVRIKRAMDRQFLILNAGMNCLMRPALYEAYHRIEALSTRDKTKKQVYTVVGPLCETTDTFAEQRELPEMLAGDWVGIFDAGAYGAVMANTYNEMPLPAQVSWLDNEWEVS